MATELGPGGSVPTGTTQPISIPQSEAPEKVLRLDEKIPLPPLYDGPDDGYKFLAIISDTSPGYLSEKIDLDQFSIVSNKLHLYSFDSLTSDNLDEGISNLYLNQINFDTFFSAKTTDELPVGVSNFYYTSALFSTDFALKTTDDLTEGSINKYMTPQILTDIGDNTAARHTHTNKSLLDSYTNSNSSIASAISNSHTHTNKSILDGTQESFTSALKTKYDNLSANSITSVLSPLILNTGVLSHSAIDGNKHVPSNSGVSQYYVLASGTNAGTYTWESPLTALNAFGAFESVPSTSTTNGVQSNYINTHVNNTTVDVKHLTNSELNFVQNTVPTHISSITKHVPDFTAADNNKFLYINGSTQLAWATSSTSITVSGETYISATGSAITANKIDLAQTNIAAGSNVTISGNQISSDQRAISSSSIDGDTTTSISAGWAYDHEILTEAGGHIPTGGTIGQYVAGNGTVQDWTTAPGAIYKISLSAGGTGGNISNRLIGSTFPTDWVGAVGPVITDLIITHTTLSEVIDVTIFTDDGTDITKLIGSAAYSTVIANQALTEIKISSLATIDEPIYLYIKFL